jgi:hypothetical protein
LAAGCSTPAPADIKLFWLLDGVVRWTGKIPNYADLPDAVWEALAETPLTDNLEPMTAPEDADAVRDSLVNWLRKNASEKAFLRLLPKAVQSPDYAERFRRSKAAHAERVKAAKVARLQDLLPFFPRLPNGGSIYS